MPIQKRSAVSVLLLSIFTCGIYYLYWLYVTSSEIDTLTGPQGDMSPGVELLLTIVTCGLYAIYWFYKNCRRLAAAFAARGAVPTDNTVLCVVLTVLGLSAISSMILQDQLNEYIDLVGAQPPYYPPTA